MFSFLGKKAPSYWGYARISKNDNEEDSLGVEDDPLLWSRDLEKHSCGEFSYAVVQANEVMEDHSQVETGDNATFVGIYDGCTGPDASSFISDHLFLNFLRLAHENGTISRAILSGAFSATEKKFVSDAISYAGRLGIPNAVMWWRTGSCCLVGVFRKGKLRIANLGNSRAVLGSVGRSKRVIAEQLTRDHSASMKEVRQEVRSLHPDNPQIVVKKNGVWSIKGTIQVSRSIGHASLKRSLFLDSRKPPVLRADPSTYTIKLQPNDKFIIFASYGLWAHLSNQEAVEIVHNNPRKGIARRLLKSALTLAAKERKISYDCLKKYEKGKRRFCHDDISVVVIFIDHEMPENKVSIPGLSVRGFVDTVGPSNIEILAGIDENVKYWNMREAIKSFCGNMMNIVRGLPFS